MGCISVLLLKSKIQIKCYLTVGFIGRECRSKQILLFCQKSIRKRFICGCPQELAANCHNLTLKLCHLKVNNSIIYRMKFGFEYNDELSLR